MHSMRKWAFEILAELFLKNEVSGDRTFSFQWVRCHSPGEKQFTEKLFEGRRNNSWTEIEIFDFHENDYNLASNTHFWARSKFNNFVNLQSLMANDGWLKSSDQAEVIFGYLAGGRDNHKKKLWVEGKQTVDSYASSFSSSVWNCVPQLKETPPMSIRYLCTPYIRKISRYCSESSLFSPPPSNIKSSVYLLGVLPTPWNNSSRVRQLPSMEWYQRTFNILKILSEWYSKKWIFSNLFLK